MTELTAVDMSGLALAAKALAKPAADLYSSATGGIKKLVSAWQNAGALDRLQQRIEDLDRIRTISSRQTASLTDIYYPARAFVKKQIRSVDHVEEISGMRNLLITGTAGQGKSVFLRYLAIQELRRGVRIPLFIELRKIDSSNDFIQILKSHLEVSGVESKDQEQLLDQLLSRGAVTLFLDGFDELSREFALPTRDKIAALLNSYKDLRVVISSRPGALSAYVQDLPKLIQAEIAPLSEQDFKPFLQKIGTPDAVIDRLHEGVNKSSTEVKRLLTTPLLLTLMVLTCGQNQQIPDSLSDFYDALFRVLAVMHDDTKPGYVRQSATSLTPIQLERLFTGFAFASREKFEKPTLSVRQFEESHAFGCKLSNIESTVEGFRTDVTETACLMVIEGLDVTFIHKSIQEYYTARFVKELADDESAKLAYESISGSRLFAWGQEIRFLEQIDEIRYRRFFQAPHIERFLQAVGYIEGGRKLFKRTELRKVLKVLALLNTDNNRYSIAYKIPGTEDVKSICIFDYGGLLHKIVEKIERQPERIENCAQLAAKNPAFLEQAEAALEKLVTQYLSTLKTISERDSSRRQNLLQVLTAAPRLPF